MKRTNRTISILLLGFMGLMLSFSACKKDAGTPTKSDLLSKSLWKMTAYTIDPAFPLFDGNGNIIGYSGDLLAQMNNCSKDDTYKFSLDNTLKYDEGASKCDSSDPQFTAGTWVFNTDETILSTTINNKTTPNTLLELTADVLKMKFTQSVGATTYTYTITFSH